MITISSDVHLRTSTFAVLQEGQRMIRKKLDNDPQQILSFVRQFEGPKTYSMEATYNWAPFYELLKDEVDDFILLHPRKLKLIAESQAKTDDYDAEQMAQLTQMGYVPKSYIANAETRQFRTLLRTYVHLSNYIRGFKTRIHAIVNTNTFYSQRPRNFKDLFCKRGMAYLDTIPLPDEHRFLVNKFLAELASLQKMRSDILQRIEAMSFHSDELKLLKTVPGMGGKLMPHLVLAEIDNIARFRNSGALVAYSGLLPRERSSGGKIRKGRLRTDCNTYLKWALLESSLGALLADKQLREYYQNIKKHSNSSGARVAVSRRLLIIIYHILKERRPYFRKPEHRE